jgi:hypothetical protein
MQSITENSQKHNHFSLFAARKRHFEHLNSAFERAMDEGRTPPMDSVDQIIHAVSDLMGTPAETLDDAAFKIEISIGEVDAVGGEGESLALLRRAHVALRAGSVSTAMRYMNLAMNGDTRWEFAYEGAAAALADLRRMEVQP